jgi:hypothetical protein
MKQTFVIRNQSGCSSRETVVSVRIWHRGLWQSQQAFDANRNSCITDASYQACLSPWHQIAYMTVLSACVIQPMRYRGTGVPPCDELCDGAADPVVLLIGG